MVDRFTQACEAVRQDVTAWGTWFFEHTLERMEGGDFDPLAFYPNNGKPSKAAKREDEAA